MPKITKIEPAVPQIKQKKKAAAYVRVSKQSERMMHSLSAQISYYSDLIQKNPDWEYVGVYADGFISGTNTVKRDEFKRMIEDCEAGKIDIILTKSISRFARNTVDLLETVRNLKSKGIEVRFEKENINSMSGDGELMLSILASFAQEESQSISENIKWSLRKRYQSGKVCASTKHILGYRYDEEKQQYIIIPEEAELVKSIFEMYLAKVSLRNIAKKLNESGYRSTHGCKFTETSINVLVQNEIYIGDIKRQKTIVTDPLTKVKVKNRGELPQYYMMDCHEPIIDRETYEKVRMETKRRSEMQPLHSCFTGMIQCEVCGMYYTRKSGKYGVWWHCRAKKEPGKTCTSPNFKESELMQICKEVIGINEFDENIFRQKVKKILILENGDIKFLLTDRREHLWKNPHLYLTKHEFTVTDCFQGKIFCGCCGKAYHRVIGANRWTYWYCMTNRQKKGCQNIKYPDYRLRKISAIILGLDEFDDSIFEKSIERMTVFENESIEYRFYDGRVKVWQKA